VVDHEVEEDVLVQGKALDVCPGAEARIDPIVGKRCKAAISRRRKRRQDVDPGEEAIKGPAKEVV